MAFTSLPRLRTRVKKHEAPGRLGQGRKSESSLALGAERLLPARLQAETDLQKPSQRSFVTWILLGA